MTTVTLILAILLGGQGYEWHPTITENMTFYWPGNDVGDGEVEYYTFTKDFGGGTFNVFVEENDDYYHNEIWEFSFDYEHVGHRNWFLIEYNGVIVKPVHIDDLILHGFWTYNDKWAGVGL